MNIKVDSELLGIFEEINREQKSLEEWTLIESGDMYQSEHYCGGFDADEGCFYFSYFDVGGNEYWFSFTLMDVETVIGQKGAFISFDSMLADK